MTWLLTAVLLFAPYADQTPEEEAAEHLSKVRRIYIAILTGGDAALQLRDLLMTSLHNSKQFVITEDEEKADATLRDAPFERTSTLEMAKGGRLQPVPDFDYGAHPDQILRSNR